MNALKIAASDAVLDCFRDTRVNVLLDQTAFIDAAVAVLSVEGLAQRLFVLIVTMTQEHDDSIILRSTQPARFT